ncbi:MAG: tyrosine-type recombinase/integrase [Gammaproteobacteria bacterium]|nr:tyrosine-type recombinase/integrase [Gammaproteobacteria bacterium]
MKLKKLIEQYINYRKSLGEKFDANSKYLRMFYNCLGKNIDISNLPAKKINNFLYRDGPITSAWFCRHTTLLGFYNYAISRGYIKTSPLPKILPKRPPAFIPYIYSKQEIKLILNTALNYQTNKSHIVPYVIQVVFLLLYATGLRLHEALDLTIGDVDLIEAVITVRETKFYKTRLVPFNMQLLQTIKEYLSWREKNIESPHTNAPLFVSLKNQPLNIGTVREIFQAIRKKAEIKRTDNARYQPRIHDLRHTFAVHHLTKWYQENKDVQKLLPVLSTYMGHTYLAATSVYLTMTRDLLREAGARFQKYAIGGSK